MEKPTIVAQIKDKTIAITDGYFEWSLIVINYYTIKKHDSECAWYAWVRKLELVKNSTLTR